MLTAEGTSITEAVLNAADGSHGIRRDGVDYKEIEYSQYTPESLHKPEADNLTADEGATRFKFYHLTIYTDEDTLTGYAIVNKLQTYGRPTAVEIHTDA